MALIGLQSCGLGLPEARGAHAGLRRSGLPLCLLRCGSSPRQACRSPHARCEQLVTGERCGPTFLGPLLVGSLSFMDPRLVGNLPFMDPRLVGSFPVVLRFLFLDNVRQRRKYFKTFPILGNVSYFRKHFLF